MESINDTKKTVIIAVLIFAILSALLALAFARDTDRFSLFGTEELVYVSSDTLSKMVSKTLIENCRINMQCCECIGEGHIILGTKSVRDNLTVYLLCRYGAYAFENGNFVRIGSHDIMPAVLTLKVSGDEQFSTVGFEFSDSDNAYADFINRLFPTECRERAMYPSSEDIKSLAQQEAAYPQAYLESIGRRAEIGGEYDFTKIPLGVIGVSENTLKVITDRYPSNPLWNGTKEIIEGDIRYVYECRLIPNSGKVLICKYPYGTLDYVYAVLADAQSGEISAYNPN